MLIEIRDRVLIEIHTPTNLKSIVALIFVFYSFLFSRYFDIKLFAGTQVLASLENLYRPRTLLLHRRLARLQLECKSVGLRNFIV